MEGKASFADVYCLFAVGDGTEFTSQLGGLVSPGQEGRFETRKREAVFHSS
jgi:hypothetical protein